MVGRTYPLQRVMIVDAVRCLLMKHSRLILCWYSVLRVNAFVVCCEVQVGGEGYAEVLCVWIMVLVPACQR